MTQERTRARTRRQVRAQLLRDLLPPAADNPPTPTHTVALIDDMGQMRAHDIYVNPPPMILHVQGIVYAREGSRIRGKLIYRETEDERAVPDEMGADPTSASGMGV